MTGFFFKPYRFWCQIVSAPLLCAAFATQPALAQFENADARVMSMFETAQADLCFTLQDEQTPDMQSWDLEFAYDYDPEQFWNFRLYRIHCSNGAYNEVHVYYGVNHNSEVSQIHFPAPHLDITYKNDDYDQSVYVVEVDGFVARAELINSEFNPEDKMIYSYSKWRGLGDASSVGQWQFHQGNFVLKAFDVDASYDGLFDMKRVYGEGEPVR